jgi:hypothetical protein
VKVITPGQPIGAGPYPPRPDPWSTGVSATEAESWTTGSMSIIGPPPAARPSWWRLAQVGGLVAGWTLVIGAASLASPVDWLHRAALFAHLVFLAIGFGAMLAVGVNAVAVLLRWVRVGRVVTLALSLDPLIWLGLAGMSVTGILLAPDLGRPWTWVKLCAVLVVALNGLWTRDLTLELRRLPARAGRGALSAGLFHRAVRVSAVSQLGWWVAVIIGFTSTNG